MLMWLLALVVVVPNPTLTPGKTAAIAPASICTVKCGKDARHVTVSMKKAVFAEYGIPWSEHAHYEVDHLISRELGGADDVRNLWPQPWTGTWNAHMKDRLENRLHGLVCNGTISLQAAQEAIRTDWRAAFTQYVQPAKATR